MSEWHHTHGQAESVGTRTYTSLDVEFSTPETVFKEGVEDTTETKRRLDDVGSKFTD